MKTFALALLLAVPALAFAQGTPAGLWKTIDDETKKEKSLIRISESGGVYTGTPMEAHTHSNSHLKGILGFVGIEDVSFISAEGMAQSPEKRDEIIAEAINRVVALAATF